MSQFVQLIKAFLPHIPSQQQLDEAYLNEAVDVYDVERRMAEITHRDAQPQFHGFALGGVLH